MTEGFEIILKLTRGSVSPVEQQRMFKDFSRLLGWEPSDRFEPDEDLQDVTNGHLIVEHGLEQSAVITFLKNSLLTLQPEQSKKILSISYNNLIDWHIYVEAEKASFVFNRRYQPEPIVHELTRTNIESLKSSMFEQITDVATNPNFPTLDDALVENISYWKRNLAAELNDKANLSDYSTLFNGIIFVRAAEDHARRLEKTHSRLLIDKWKEIIEGNRKATLKTVIEKTLKKFVTGTLPKNYLDLQKLKVFDVIPSELTYELLASFYKSRNIPYPYDFAIMSKHALSRIYEHYVSLLRFDEEDQQLYFIPPLPSEQFSKSYGAVYTPQFIARFFARFLLEQKPLSVFRSLSFLDPACGSGIFLRTILEFKCAPAFDGISSIEIETIFSNVQGVDIDVNATQATKLSLSLLYLVLMSGKLPKKLNIISDDALQYFSKHTKLKNSIDIVITNPPYISFDYQSQEIRERVEGTLGELTSKKPDIYLSFLKIAIDVLKPGGYGLFVLPHTFLRSVSAEKLRIFIHQNAWISCLVDLSTISVFKEKGSYVILLIYQKKYKISSPEPKATIILCQDFVGQALQDYLSGKRTENRFYSIYDIEQNSFENTDWSKILIPPSQLSVIHKIEKFTQLNKFFEIKQGVVTGGDEVFLISKSQVPTGEGKVWKPLLKDREMERYIVPKLSNCYIFYPIVEGEKLTEENLKKNFPKTWKYLLLNKGKLPPRKVTEQNWWLPTRLRDPNKLFIPKILTPHLVLLPKFSLDIKGKYAISHAPYLFPKNYSSDEDFLKFFLAILNSTIGAWLISTSSDKYSRGYARLEVKTLGSIPVPDPAKVEYSILSNLLNLVESKLKGDKDQVIDKEIDELVGESYGLNHDEKLVVGFEK